MSVKSLVLVVGAGASKEVDLPTGAELKSLIADVLNIKYSNGYRKISGDDLMDQAYRRMARDINPLLHAGWRIAAAMPQAMSIDNYIDSHRSDELIATCGKLAIARCILDAEHRSKLFVEHPGGPDARLEFSNLDATWFNAFFQLLTENCQEDDLPARLSKVAIITFNYDRCIEHFLHESLQNYYAMSRDEATGLLGALEVHHPYGTVGKLPWQAPIDGVAYGGTVSADVLLKSAAGLRTFTEGTDPDLSDINEIRSTLASAQRIAFLGFAFHRLNLELLFEGGKRDSEARLCEVFATAFGLSPSDLLIVSRQLSSLAHMQHEGFQLRNNLRCAELFREYWRSLSLL